MVGRDGKEMAYAAGPGEMYNVEKDENGQKDDHHESYEPGRTEA